MKVVRTNIFYIIVVWTLIVVLLGSVLYMGYNRNVKDLRQLMVNEAKRFTDIVTVATAVGAGREGARNAVSRRQPDGLVTCNRIESPSHAKAVVDAAVGFAIEPNPLHR